MFIPLHTDELIFRRSLFLQPDIASLVPVIYRIVGAQQAICHRKRFAIVYVNYQVCCRDICVALCRLMRHGETAHQIFCVGTEVPTCLSGNTCYTQQGNINM